LIAIQSQAGAGRSVLLLLKQFSEATNFYELLNNHERTEDEGINIICHNSVNNTQPIEMGQLGFSFA